MLLITILRLERNGPSTRTFGCMETEPGAWSAARWGRPSNRGSTLRIIPEPTLTSKTDPSSRPYVLVVEDEFFSRFHAVNLVEAAGYRAIEAANADEAIAILEARKDIRIVFTDIDMPGSMDGLKLAHAVRHRWPPIELILPPVISMCRRATFPKGVYFSPSPIAMTR
jgi:hypothetical protein